MFKGHPGSFLPSVHRYLSVLILAIVVTKMCNGDSYLEERRKILQQEEGMFTGGAEELTKKEEIVNEYLLKIKKKELKESHASFSEFLPAKNFLKAKSDIEKSEVFQFIKKLPKGASLHTHMLAGVNVDYVIQNFTYHENVYGCFNSLGVFKLKVLENAKQGANCSWKSLGEYRKEYKERNASFDQFLKSQMTLDASWVDQTREKVWARFKNTFSTLYDLVAYRPLFKEYIYQILEELYQDNVFYTELRGTIMPLYDLNGTVYGPKEFFDTFIEVVEDFKATHPGFLGVKYIHSIYRGVNNDTLRSGLEDLINLQTLYPDFIAGFDFVGLEEEGKQLVDFHDELVDVSKKLKFFFHAGETFQYGYTDLNLVDAVLLNSSRIGHGFALAKHPALLELARKLDIAVELSPISNQVLKLNSDPRNHPATVLLSRGHPVVICNDDPATWEASGLSYDWYVVFMSMTWENQGLQVLKKFAQDSITYSAMTSEKKIEAMKIWQVQWDEFIGRIVKNSI